MQLRSSTRAANVVTSLDSTTRRTRRSEVVALDGDRLACPAFLHLDAAGRGEASEGERCLGPDSRVVVVLATGPHLQQRCLFSSMLLVSLPSCAVLKLLRALLLLALLSWSSRLLRFSPPWAPATMNLLESLSRRVQLVARPLTLYQPTKQRMRTLGNREKRRTFARKSAGCYSRACYFPIQILQPAFLGSPSLFPLLHPRWRTSTRASLRTSESSPSSLTSSADSSVSPPGSSHRLNYPNSLNHLFRQQGRFVPSPTPRLGSRRCQHG